MDIYLIARREGKLVYIPLSASGNDDADDKDPSQNPCDHPEGGSAGVTHGDAYDDDGSSADASSSDGGAGGVPAAGEPHIGDNDCQCP